MEFKEFILFLKQNKEKILGLGAVFGVLGVLAFFFLPVRYKASGSLFVTRKADKVSSEFFTYEGYYAQQTAHSYANTVGGLLESIDVKRAVLEDLGIPVTHKEIRRLGRQLQVKRPSLQLVLVEVKARSEKEAGNIWRSFIGRVIETSLSMNRSGDPSISVVQISESPVVQPAYRNVYLFALVGFGFGLLTGALISAIREYFK